MPSTTIVPWRVNKSSKHTGSREVIGECCNRTTLHPYLACSSEPRPDLDALSLEITVLLSLDQTGSYCCSGWAPVCSPCVSRPVLSLDLSAGWVWPGVCVLQCFGSRPDSGGTRGYCRWNVGFFYILYRHTNHNSVIYVKIIENKSILKYWCISISNIIMVYYYFWNSVALFIQSCFPFMFCVDLCWLNKHTGGMDSVADSFLLCPTCHGLPAVIIVFKEGAGTLCSAAEMCIYLFLLLAHNVVLERYW